jgi:hypothetical protein
MFEIIRYYSIYYQNFSGEFSDNEDDDISKILTQNDDKLLKLNYINEEVIKKWYEGFLRLMSSSFKEYKNKSKLNYIIVFICLLAIVIIYYCIVWKMSEEKLNILLKSSADLINLIPQEIKNIIIEKINE